MNRVQVPSTWNLPLGVYFRIERVFSAPGFRPPCNYTRNQLAPPTSVSSPSLSTRVRKYPARPPRYTLREENHASSFHLPFTSRTDAGLLRTYPVQIDKAFYRFVPPALTRSCKEYAFVLVANEIRACWSEHAL